MRTERRLEIETLAQDFKINKLCSCSTMKSICFICLSLIAAVNVSSAEPVELHHKEGDTVTFPTAVRNSGTFAYRGRLIGDVRNSHFIPVPKEQFTGRVQWDSHTGLFSITGLKMEDSGLYNLNDYVNLNAVYQLTVSSHENPPRYPHVRVSKLKISRDSYPCSYVCIMEEGTEVTLSWHRKGEAAHINSPPVNAPYHLPLRAEQSGTYTCEAKNSISSETISVAMEEECIGSYQRKVIIGLSTALAITWAIIILVCVCKACCSS
ncbi:hypothetical protein AGOR_G00195070 [Albula goreensis]|uniref:Ig-like domain-containing protein n=1 Tax=Albula goreensis TaxID=1534307 RepID=A0A8T3CW69_9TELE|nr:hypothetical protein AGOR_G00195070 [Albula goreensis]